MSDTFEMWFARFWQYDLVSSPIDALVRGARKCDVEIDQYKTKHNRAGTAPVNKLPDASFRENKGEQQHRLLTKSNLITASKMSETYSTSPIKKPVTWQHRLTM
jgi:hypothetical protein